jgi:hypothetical protein
VGWRAATRLARALPQVHARAEVAALGPGVHRVRLILDNRGYLATSGLLLGETGGASPRVSASLALAPGQALCAGSAEVGLAHMDGWGTMQATSARHPVYMELLPRGHRSVAEWVVRGGGALELAWMAGRGGRGTLTVDLGAGTPAAG